jgi:hypothetical protein
MKVPKPWLKDAWLLDGFTSVLATYQEMAEMESVRALIRFSHKAYQYDVLSSL